MQVIDFQQTRAFQERNAATLINVLPAEYFAKTHIPGSINIPYDHPDFSEEVKSVLGGKDQPVIVYCASFECDASKKAAKKLIDAGFSNIMCYEGGMKEWQEKAAGRAA